ncbi:MAG: HNH endonuclease [Eubacteriales bacterium]
MPQRLKRPCTYPGCPELTDGGRCEKHKKQEARRYDEQRGTRQERGYTEDWLKVRRLYLVRHSLCERCEDKGLVVAAEMVHHKQAIRQGGAALDGDNLMSVCRKCHDELHSGDRGV